MSKITIKTLEEEIKQLEYSLSRDNEQLKLAMTQIKYLQKHIEEKVFEIEEHKTAIKVLSRSYNENN